MIALIWIWIIIGFVFLVIGGINENTGGLAAALLFFGASLIFLILCY